VRSRSLTDLEARLGHCFQNPTLLRLALTHPSVTHEQSGATPHNQRLEFLGDAVLQLVITRELYLRFPDSDEGPLTKTRAHLVNARSLAERGRRLGLGDFLILSVGEEAQGGRQRASALADAFEAVIGAIYLDGDLAAAQVFVTSCFQDAFAEIDQPLAIDNPKGELQELLQATSSEPPQYQLISTTGPDHDRNFECEVVHRGTVLGRGVGKSKKAAESEAALEALAKLRPPGMQPQTDSPA
jgi:ribonuclease-3